QLLRLPFIAVDHRNVIERLTVALPLLDTARDIVGLVAEVIEAAKLRLRAADPGHFRSAQRHMILVGVLSLQKVLGKVVSETEDFPGVAVVQLQDSSTAPGLNAGAGERKLEMALFV